MSSSSSSFAGPSPSRGPAPGTASLTGANAAGSSPLSVPVTLTAAWRDELERFTTTLEATQQDLLATLRLKRQVLAKADVAGIERLNAQALEAAKRLQILTQWRARLLEDAALQGHLGQTLSDVLAAFIDPAAEQLRGRLAAIQQRFGEVRREAWIEWIVTHRAASYYGEVLNLIAAGGQRSAGYLDGGQPATLNGAAMLDTAV